MSSQFAIFVCQLIHTFFVTYTLKSCFKAVNKLLIPLSTVWKSYIRFLVRLCTHNINFDVRNFDLFLRKIINLWGCNISLNWQVKTTYSWRGLSGRMSLFKTNLTGVPSLTSPPRLAFIFSRSRFFFAPLPTIWTPGTGYAGPKLVGIVVSVCTPLPTGRNKSQHCWHNNVGSCRARLHAVLVSPFPLFLKEFRKKAGFVTKTKIWPKKYCKNQDRHSLELKFEHDIIIMENAIKINVGIAQRFKQ